MNHNFNTITWDPLPHSMSTAPGRVETIIVSLSPLETSITRFEGLLAPDELTRSRNIQLVQNKKRFIICRGLLRIILGRYLDAAPHLLAFNYDHLGKPYIDASKIDRSPIYFNLSHSGNFALFVVSHNSKIGVDIERLRPIGRTGYGIPRTLSLSSDEDIYRFFRLWVYNEAYFKATGYKLSLDLKLLEESPGIIEYGDLIIFKDTDWKIIEFFPSRGYCAAICTERNVSQHKWYQWDSSTIWGGDYKDAARDQEFG